MVLNLVPKVPKPYDEYPLVPSVDNFAFYHIEQCLTALKKRGQNVPFITLLGLDFFRQEHLHFEFLQLVAGLLVVQIANQFAGTACFFFN